MTDAHVVLGHLDPATPLAGDLVLDESAARDAIGRLAADLGLDVPATAAGILRVADAEMVRALRVMTVERGLDPRDFALLAFGGAGPLHAAGIADELGIRRIVVPRAGGVLSALGLAAADRRHDEARTLLLRGDEITTQALEAATTGADEVAWDARYRGQSFELTLHGVPPDPGALRAAFDAEHDARYGYADPEAELEVVTVRRTSRTPGPDLDLLVDAGAGADERLVRGPTVIALPGATLVIAEGWSGTADDTGTFILERDGEPA